MRKSHSDLESASGGGDELFVYNQVKVFISVCAPIKSTRAEVEAFANANGTSGPYEAIDKVSFGRKIGIDMGDHTPSPCNWEPDVRKHWFLVSKWFA